MMKKIVALFLTCAMALSLTASAAGTWLFSRNQFQTTKAPATKADGTYYVVTFPLVYKGTLKWNGWYINDKKPVCVDTVKITPELYMTICQPCIDCFPCQGLGFAAGVQAIANAPATVPEAITAWNLYVVIPYKVGKVSQTAIRKVNLGDLDGNGAAAIFFTGAKNGLAMVQAYLDTTDSLNFGESIQFIMTGKKSDYTFTYTEADLRDPNAQGEPSWENIEAKYNKNKAYIKSVTAFAGALNVALPYDTFLPGEGYHVNGVVDLKRDATLTKMVAKAVFGIGYTSTKNWEDCGEDAAYCEMYFQPVDPQAPAYDLFDEYLEFKYIKTIDLNGIVLNATIDQIFTDAYQLVY